MKAEGGNVQVRCGRCREMNSVGSTSGRRWEARCSCGALLYRYNIEVAGEVETKCRNCGDINLRRPLANITNRR
jgi:phage FluMu protein Com